MEANCKVWSRRLDKFTSGEFHISYDGKVFARYPNIERYEWKQLPEKMIKEMGLSFYPGV
jgi:hypothetical protein